MFAALSAVNLRPYLGALRYTGARHCSCDVARGTTPGRRRTSAPWRRVYALWLLCSSFRAALAHAAMERHRIISIAWIREGMLCRHRLRRGATADSIGEHFRCHRRCWLLPTSLYVPLLHNTCRLLVSRRRV